MNKNFIVGFFASLVMCAAIAWLSGYNFDERSPMVAWMAFNSVCLSVVGGIFAIIQGDDK